MVNNPAELLPGARAIIQNAAVIQPGERVTILADSKSKSIARHFLDAVSVATDETDLIIVPLAKGHGQEPPASIAEKSLAADVVLACTTFSLSHSLLRVNFCKKGGRFLSLADYDLNMLRGGGTMADYAAMVPIVQRVANFFESGQTVRLTTKLGTDITLSAEGRDANAASAYCTKPGDFGSPPDIEANFAPVEHLTEGLLIVDGSIPVPQIGLLKKPITVEVRRGRAVKVRGGEQADMLCKIWDSYGDSSVRIAAELGIGLNPAAKLCGRMLEDEGVFGTAHIGFGANTTIGGQNAGPVHIDLICREATVTVDEKVIMKNGQLLSTA
ncbi:MAG: hypothetical protein GWP14_00395 [Actinobacteria bacterium]|nr:hypothetical protein [Actinomycetota bacterium]